MANPPDASDLRNRSYSPAQRQHAVTPSDTDDLPFVTRGIYTGAGGDIAIRTPNGDTVTYVGTIAGTIIPIGASRVLATGTAAINIIAMG